MATITIDQSECLGCEACVGLCPEVFRMAGDTAEVIAPAATLPCVDEAIDVCPVDCISRI